jgi:uncharacterized repeat protein (TIGR01451 family)
MKFLLLIFMLAVSTAQAGTFRTYAAWADPANSGNGYMYIYTGDTGGVGTTITLYSTTAAGIRIDQPGNIYPGFPMTVPDFTPIAVGPFGQRYFMVESSDRIIWEVEEPIPGPQADSHDFLAAADGNNSYIGGIFMTYMRPDQGNTPFNIYTGDWGLMGDHVALINPGAGPVTVQVQRYSGGVWNTVLASSPGIPSGGVWMWAPNMNGDQTAGGTAFASEGHYRFNVSGGQAMLFKGNAFTPKCLDGINCIRDSGYPADFHFGNRDNLALFGPDMNTGKKVGTALVGAVLDSGPGPRIVVNNQDNFAANFHVERFIPAVVPASWTNFWPVNSNFPAGTWTPVAGTNISGLAPGDHRTFSPANTPGFYRVVSDNGALLSAMFGDALLDPVWCDGDYAFASDTREPFGRNFLISGRVNLDLPYQVQLHVIAPLASTQVNVRIRWSNGVETNSVQTTGVNNAGINFSFTKPGSVPPGSDFTIEINANRFVYTYIMSATYVDGANVIAGETFFSVPPPIDPVLYPYKSPSTPTASVGDLVTYTIVADNPSAQDLALCSVEDSFDSRWTFISSNPAPSVSGPPLWRWELGTIPSGQSREIEVVVQLNSVAQSGDWIGNTVRAFSQFSIEEFAADPVFVLDSMVTATPTPTPSMSATFTETPTQTETFTETPTFSPSPTITQTPIPSPHKINLKVYNSAGEQIKVLFDGMAEFLPDSFNLPFYSLSSGQNLVIPFEGNLVSGGQIVPSQIVWNLDNDSGQPVASGVYYIKLELMDVYERVWAYTGKVNILNSNPQNTFNVYNNSGELVWQKELTLDPIQLTEFLAQSRTFSPSYDSTGLIIWGTHLSVKTRDELGGEQTIVWDGKNLMGSPVTSGIYHLQLVYKNSSGRTLVMSDQVQVIKGEQPPDDLEEFLVVPNPVNLGNDGFYLYYPAKSSVRLIRTTLYNLSGEKVRTGSASQSVGSVWINTSGLAPGVYTLMVELVEGRLQLSTRVIKVAIIK